MRKPQKVGVFFPLFREGFKGEIYLGSQRFPKFRDGSQWRETSKKLFRFD